LLTFLSGAIEPHIWETNNQLGLLVRTGRKEEGEKQLALAKGLRNDQEVSSRLQLRLLDPDGVTDRDR
jgi:hypothetical protein